MAHGDGPLAGAAASRPPPSNSVSIRLVPGNVVPRAHELGGSGALFEQVKLLEVVITEQGTASGLPIVDFVCEDAEGKTLLFSTTGRLVNGVAAAVKGVNTRIHGIAEP
jgi:hypothetical protein